MYPVLPAVIRQLEYRLKVFRLKDIRLKVYGLQPKSLQSFTTAASFLNILFKSKRVIL